MRIEVTQKGITTAVRKIRTIGANAENSHAMLIELAYDLGLIEYETFRSQGRRGGGSWKKLKPDTVYQKLSRGLDVRILHATHELRDSLVQRKHPQHVEKITGTQLRFGTDVRYAGVHQKGAPRAKVPARPFFKLTPGDKKRHAKIVTGQLIKDWDGHDD